MNSIENMKAIELAFRDAYNHTVSHFPDAARKNIITRFTSSVTMQYSMYLVFTSDGLKKAISDVFGNDTIRDFVLRLTSSFFARLGNYDDELHNVLASAMCVFPVTSNQNTSMETVALPEEIKSRLPEYDDIRMLLASNKWLITVTMISLYLRVEIDSTR